MTLSILIPTLPSRKNFLGQLMKVLEPQLTDEVEVITDDREKISTGNKRNHLIAQAKGKYTVFVDDDDLISEDYVSLILEAAKKDPDCIVFTGWMTTNGLNKCHFRLGLALPYCTTLKDGRPFYLRYPNHITPIRRSIASQVNFQNRTLGEDYEWATEINNRGLLKTEVFINKDLYFYLYRTNK